MPQYIGQHIFQRTLRNRVKALLSPYALNTSFAGSGQRFSDKDIIRAPKTPLHQTFLGCSSDVISTVSWSNHTTGHHFADNPMDRGGSGGPFTAPLRARPMRMQTYIFGSREGWMIDEAPPNARQNQIGQHSHEACAGDKFRYCVR